jgi:threonine dehydrogenase-like Zn-dependent dehydrogenase
VSHLGAGLSARWDRARRREATWRALTEIDTAPLVTHRVALADAARAYELADARASGALQILLTGARLA